MQKRPLVKGRIDINDIMDRCIVHCVHLSKVDVSIRMRFFAMLVLPVKDSLSQRNSHLSVSNVEGQNERR